MDLMHKQMVYFNMESPASRNNEPVALRNGNSGREERVAEGCIGMDGNQASQKKFRSVKN